MRSVFAISTAIALFVSSAYATNADFSPVNFAEEVVVASTPLSDTFATFRWKGEEAVAKESFDLTVEDGARIQVTDFKNRGDMFEVFANGKSLGMTTKVDALKDDQVFAATPEEALKDERFSKGVFDLAKGTHKITIKAVGPYEAGTAAIRVLNHANVAFHKKGGKKDDDKDDDKHDDKDDDDKDDDKHGDKHDDDDEEDEEEDDHRHKKGNKGGNRGHGGNKGGNQGGNQGGHGGNKGYGNKGGNGGGYRKKEPKYPGQGLDLSHTVTLTKTRWVHETATFMPSPDFDEPMWGGQDGWGDNQGDWEKPGWGGQGGWEQDNNQGGHGGQGGQDDSKYF